MLRCIICNHPFYSTNANQITCANPVCRIKRQKQSTAKWEKQFYKNYIDTFKCPFCNSKSIRRRSDQKTCGDKKCILKRRMERYYGAKIKGEKEDERNLGQI